MAIARDWLIISSRPWQDREDLEEKIAQLKEQLARERESNAQLSAASATMLAEEWHRGNHGRARVTTLTARTKQLLRLAKYWREPGRKPTPEHVKQAMMLRYVELGGLERGKGLGAKLQVVDDFRVSVSTVNRIIREFKGRTIIRAEAARLVLRHRRLRELKNVNPLTP